jgi:biotin operon repressor
MKLARNQIRLLLELSNSRGYSNQELAKRLELEESNISKPLNKLLDKGLVFKRKRQHKSDKRHSDEPYYLQKSKAFEIFRAILEYSAREDVTLRSDLFESRLLDHAISNSDLLSIMNLFKEYGHEKYALRSLSKLFFDQGIIKEEYKKVIDRINKYPEDWSWFQTNLYAQDFVKILQHFDSLAALKFYQKVIGKTFPVLYSKRAEENNIKDYELLGQLAEYDVALSPFSSFPVSDPILLLFLRPFERIYDDVYLCEESDFETLIKRAYLIYSNFAQILAAGIRQIREEEDYFDAMAGGGVESDEEYQKATDRHFINYLRRDLFFRRDRLRPLVSELIFYWNIASLRLDWIYSQLKFLTCTSHGIGEIKYHVLTGYDGIQVIDLKTLENIPFAICTREDMVTTSLWSGDDADPFGHLRYCECFKDFNLEQRPTSIDEIVPTIGDRLEFKP